MTAYIAKSKRDDWRTPKWLIDAVHIVCGEITFDMYTEESNPTRAKCWEWPKGRKTSAMYGDRLVSLWCNPPYGPFIKVAANRWSAACSVYRMGLLLIPSRTDTKAFRIAYDACTSVFFFSGRLYFDDGKMPAPFPSCLFIHASDEDSERLVSEIRKTKDGIWMRK